MEVRLNQEESHRYHDYHWLVSDYRVHNLHH